MDLYDGPRRVATHERVPEASEARVTLVEHRPPRSAKVFARDASSSDERELAKGGPEIAAYVALLKKRGRSWRALRRLMTMVNDYPREPLVAAVRIATHYGLDDMDRLESLVLRHVAGDFFPLPSQEVDASKHGNDRSPPADTPESNATTTDPEDDDDG